MERLKITESALARVESWLLVVLLAGMVILAFTQVVLRQIDRGWLWADTLLRHLVLWVGFLGAALASADDKHFAWEAATARLSGKKKAAAQLAAHAACAAVCVLLTQAAWAFLLQEKSSGETLFTAGPVAVPAWMMMSIIPGGFILILIHTSLKALRAALEIAA